MSRASRLRLALGLNIAIVVVQVVYALGAGSLGLLADAGHNLTDAAAVGLSLIAVQLTKRGPTHKQSFGYHRGTILAAQANAATIIAVTGLIGFESIRRLMHPQPVHAKSVVVVALIATLINSIAAVSLHEKGHDLNMRSALLHMAGDAIASLGVAGAGIVILLTKGNFWLDPVVSMAIGLLIAWQAVKLLKATTGVLMESTPAGLDVHELASAMAEMKGVDDVHDLHVWNLSSELRALSAHVLMSGRPTLHEAQLVGEEVKAMIGRRFHIGHATLELECEVCSDEVSERCAMEGLAK